MATSVSQAALAGTILLAAWLTFVAVTPPTHKLEEADGDSDDNSDDGQSLNNSSSDDSNQQEEQQQQQEKSTTTTASTTTTRLNIPSKPPLLRSPSSFLSSSSSSTPRPPPPPPPKTGDFIRAIQLTHHRGPAWLYSHMAVLALYTAYLAAQYSPSTQEITNRWGWTRHCAANGLNESLLTWSFPHTILPLFLILCLGVPLRLIPYADLGKNFTFALAEPDRLITTGIYKYVQHPSYTGLACLLAGNSLMYYRTDTPAVTCLVSPQWYPMMRMLLLGFLWPSFVFAGASGISIRVREEEQMLKAKFGKEWEQWHARTARFIPGVF